MNPPLEHFLAHPDPFLNPISKPFLHDPFQPSHHHLQQPPDPFSGLPSTSSATLHSLFTFLQARQAELDQRLSDSDRTYQEQLAKLEGANRRFIDGQNAKIKETLEMQKRVREAVSKQEELVKGYEMALS